MSTVPTHDDGASKNTPHDWGRYVRLRVVRNLTDVIRRWFRVEVAFADGVDDSTPVPPATGRTIYRIVQEGITNVRKHAPGVEVDIRSTGDPSAGITVVLANPLGPAAAKAPGAGLGLVGLRERAELRGGRLHQRTEGATFVLEAWVPWTA